MRLHWDALVLWPFAPTQQTDQSPFAKTASGNSFITTNVYHNTYNNTYSVPSLSTFSTNGGVTESELEGKLGALADSLRFQSMPKVPSSGGNANNIALLQKVDNLDGTHLSNISVDGVSGLTPSDIPALPYLAVSGGTFSGALFNSSTDLSSFAGGLSVASLNVTSTSSTSTFADNINLTSGCFSINGTCITSGGSGTPGGTNGELQFNNNGSFDGASSLVFNAGTGQLNVGNIVITDSTTTNATTTNFYSTNAVISDLGLGSVSVSGTSTLSTLILSNDNCSSFANGGKLTTDASGNVMSAPDQGGGGAAAGDSNEIQFNGSGGRICRVTSEFTFSTFVGIH